MKYQYTILLLPATTSGEEEIVNRHSNLITVMQQNNMTDFFDIEYLGRGNERQRATYTLVKNYSLLKKLAVYDPVIAGTIPIGIDIPGSDLDILCCWDDKEKFKATINYEFLNNKDFNLREKEIDGNETLIANFLLEEFAIEIFGQKIPVRQQYGYCHMIIEDRLLRQHGDQFRQQIIALKKTGYKTEPAFAHLLHLPGDPYDALLQLGFDEQLP